MTHHALLGFRYRFERGPAPARTLVLLHGTGADENDLIPLGHALDADANLLAPRGRVVENGMPRFFRRLSEGVFDVDDLKARTHELVEFLEGAATEHGLNSSGLVAVGFSNGANIAGSMLLLRPTVLAAAVLLRPMVPFEPDPDPDLAGMRVFIGAGGNDPLIDARETERLADIFRRAGADVTLVWSGVGHQLHPDEVYQARDWLTQPS